MADIGSVSDDEAFSLTEVKVSGGNLIGFKTSTSLTSDEPQIDMIKSIRPILDKSNCEYSAADLLPYQTVKIDYVAGDPAKTVAVDIQLKDLLFNSICAHTLQLTPASNFVSIQGNYHSWRVVV